MSAGKIIYYFEHKEILAGICLYEKDGKYHLLLPGPREINLQKKRAIHLTTYAVDENLSRDDRIRFVSEKAALQQKLSDALSVSALWQGLAEKGTPYDIPALTAAAFSGKTDSDHQMALIRALMKDSVHFKMKGPLFLANTPEQVEKLREKEKQEARKQQEIESFTLWFDHLVNAGRLTQPRDDFVSHLKAYVIDGKEAAEYSIIKNALKKKGVKTEKACFDLLVKTGVFDPDENLVLTKHRVPAQWPEDICALQESGNGPDIRSILNDPSRTDLSRLDTFSIDDSATRDIDDALSITPTEDGFIVHVHIADAAALITPGSPVDLEAKKRGRSLYLPDTKIPMIPEVLSENILSLKQDELRPAVTIRISLSRDGDIINYSAHASIIRNDRRMSYDEADIEIKNSSDFAAYYSLATRLRERRLKNGASGILLPELMIRITPGGEISAVRRERETESQVLVSELMILANYCASRMFAESACPVLFRKQSQPAQNSDPGPNPSLFDLFSLRKNFGRVDIGTDPEPHQGLGLDSYVTLTSPLRKYLDLVAQRQLLKLIKKEPPVYDPKSLAGLAEALQPVLTRSAIAEQERRRYWLLKILEKQKGQPLEALVLDKRYRGYGLLLTDYYMDVHLKASRDIVLSPGETVPVIIKTIDPFAGQLQIALADSPFHSTV